MDDGDAAAATPSEVARIQVLSVAQTRAMRRAAEGHQRGGTLSYRPARGPWPGRQCRRSGRHCSARRRVRHGVQEVGEPANGDGRLAALRRSFPERPAPRPRPRRHRPGQDRLRVSRSGRRGSARRTHRSSHRCGSRSSRRSARDTGCWSAARRSCGCLALGSPGGRERDQARSAKGPRRSGYPTGTLFARLGRRAGVHANPHRLRHTFATWAIEKEARELGVQYLLRHSTSAMVRRYAATEASGRRATAIP